MAGRAKALDYFLTPDSNTLVITGGRNAGTWAIPGARRLTGPESQGWRTLDHLLQPPKRLTDRSDTSPDGRWKLEISISDKALRVRDAAGQLVRELRAHRRTPVETLFSADNRLAVSVAKEYSSNEGNVGASDLVVWEVATWEPVFQSSFNTDLTAAFSPDSRFLLLGTDRLQIFAIDPAPPTSAGASIYSEVPTKNLVKALPVSAVAAPSPTAPAADGAGGARITSTPAGLVFQLRPKDPATDALRAELQEKEQRYAVKGLSKDENSELKERIGILRASIAQADGSFKPVTGQTPAELAGLATGAYSVVFSRPGWPAITRGLNVEKDLSVEVSAAFVGGDLKVTSDPAGASVSRNGKTLGVTPVTLKDHPPGSYRLDLSRKGYKSSSVEAHVAAGETSAVSAKLEKQPTFAGTWAGTVTFSGSDGTGGPNTFSITVSSDEKTVWTRWATSGGSGFQSVGYRTGDVLTWSFEQKTQFGGSGDWIATCTLHLLGERTAEFVRDINFVAGPARGTTGGDRGILTKQ